MSQQHSWPAGGETDRASYDRTSEQHTVFGWHRILCSHFTDDLICLFETNEQKHGVGLFPFKDVKKKLYFNNTNYALFFLVPQICKHIWENVFFFIVHILSHLPEWYRGLWSDQVPHKWCFKGTPNFSWGLRSWINREKSHQRTIQLHWNSSHSSLKERVKCLDLAGAVFYKLQSHCFLRERVWHLKVSIVQPPDIPCWAFFPLYFFSFSFGLRLFQLSAKLVDEQTVQCYFCLF